MYSLKGKIIGCDIKNKLDINSYNKNLGKEIDNKELSRQLAAAYNLNKNTIKMRDKTMSKIISENIEKGNIHIGIFGAEHIEGISKHLKNNGLKVEKIKLKEFGYKEDYIL